VTVLELPPVSSAETPVKAAIAAKAREVARICFIHVPKAAGTSVIALMQQHLGATNLYHAENRHTLLVAQLLRRYRFVAGHFFLRDFAADAFRDSYIFTILRDPVERVLSQYRYFRRVQGVSDDRDVHLAKQNDLADILRRPKHENNARWINAMTTRFSGEGVHKIADRESLRKAKHHLRLLDLVGIQESFPETYSRLAEDLGWKESEVLFYNQTEQNPVAGKLEPDLHELIGERNWLDRELYEEARALFCFTSCATCESRAIAGNRRNAVRPCPPLRPANSQPHP
jgi:hypothetical protein